jgi:hypothetical protein
VVEWEEALEFKPQYHKTKKTYQGFLPSVHRTPFLKNDTSSASDILNLKVVPSLLL